MTEPVGLRGRIILAGGAKAAASLKALAVAAEGCVLKENGAAPEGAAPLPRTDAGSQKVIVADVRPATFCCLSRRLGAVSGSRPL